MVALSTKLLNHDESEATGNISYTGTGFQPKAQLALGAIGTGFKKDVREIIGIASGASDRACIYGFSDDGVGTSDCLRRHDNAHVYMDSNVAGD